MEKIEGIVKDVIRSGYNSLDEKYHGLQITLKEGKKEILVEYVPKNSKSMEKLYQKISKLKGKLSKKEKNLKIRLFGINKGNNHLYQGFGRIKFLRS